MGVFAVDFDRDRNPVLEVPDGNIKGVLPNDAIFHPIEIKGAWLKIRWDGSKGSGLNTRSGWIKWKENEEILLELSYMS